jgi:hypothetical protein
MDIQHTAVVWRLLFDHISALNTKIGYLFLFSPRGYAFTVSGGLLAWVFEGFLGKSGGVGGASGGAWKRIVPPANQGIEPPRFYPTH